MGRSDPIWVGCSKVLTVVGATLTGICTDTLAYSCGTESQPGWTLHSVSEASSWGQHGAVVSHLCDY